MVEKKVRGFSKIFNILGYNSSKVNESDVPANTLTPALYDLAAELPPEKRALLVT